MNRYRLFALLLLPLVLSCAIGYLLVTNRGERGDAPDAHETVAATAEEPADADPVELALPTALRDSAATTRVEEPWRSEEAAPELGETQSFDIETAHWVDVNLVLPEGVPQDDELSLLAFSAEPGEKISDRRLHLIGRNTDFTASFLDDVEDDEHWSRREVAGSGVVRVPFHAESSGGALLLVSRYAFAPVQRVALSVDESVTIEAELGAYVTGRIVIPDGVEDRNIVVDDFELQFEGRGEGGFMAGTDDSRGVRIADDFTYEVRALSANKKYFVNLIADRLVDFVELRFAAAPGEHRVYDISPRAGAVVSGRVVTKGTGAPVVGARVHPGERGGPLVMMGNGNEDGETDENGAFTIQGLVGGELSLRAEANGYLDAKGTNVTTVEGEHLRDVEIVLDRGNEIAGRVQWADGSAAIGAGVFAVLRGSTGPQNVGTTSSGEDGSFVLSGLKEGPHMVHAELVPTSAGQERPSDAKSDDSALWRARALDIQPNSSGLVLVLRKPSSFTGLVVDDTGAPVQEFRIQANLAGSPPVVRVFESADGTFELSGVHDGDWVIQASAAGYSRSEEHDVAITVPHGGGPVVLRLERSITVAGLVVDPAGNAVAGADVTAAGAETDSVVQGGTREQTRSDEEGRFEFEDVSPSGIALTASSEGWAPSETVPVIAAPGETMTDVVVALRIGVIITGEVYDENGEPDIGTTVNAGAGQSGMYGGGGVSTRADAAGRFRLEHVPPGRITVSTMPNEDEIFDMLEAAGDAEDASAVEQEVMTNVFGQLRMETVDVADGEEVHVVLGAEPKSPVRVTGTILEGGEVVGGASLMVYEDGGSFIQGMKMTSSDESGDFAVTLDRPGEFVFNVSRDGMGDRRIPFFVDVPDEPEHRLDLDLPLASIAGRVVGPDGTGLEGITVRLAEAGGLLGVFDLDQTRGTATDSGGSFLFDHLDPATYTLHVGGNRLSMPPTAQHYGAEVVDGLELGADERLEDLVVSLSPAGRVVGKVTDSSGNPVVGAAVFVRNASGHVLSIVSTCTTDGTGDFTYDGVPTEAVTVFARKDDSTSVEVGPLEVEGHGDASVELTLAKGCYLTVTSEQDREPIRARVEVIDEQGRRVNGMLSPDILEAMFMQGFSSKERRVGPLPPGKYILRAVGPDGKDAKESVTVRAGQTERLVKLRLN